MAHRHRVHKKAHGGRTVYAGKGSNVEHEAEEHKRGGKVHHLGKMHGHKGKHRLDKRARGGGVGADKSPFSSAAHGMSGHGADHGAASHTHHRGKVQSGHGGHHPHPTMHKSHGGHRGHHVKGG